MASVSAIIWQVFAKKMFATLAVTNQNFAKNSVNYIRVTAAVLILFHSTLWAIKISFLLFFKRLGKNVQRQKIMWWLIFGFTLATYFVCLGLVPYPCLIASRDTLSSFCTRNLSVNFQLTTIKLSCACDVITDFLSSPPCLISKNIWLTRKVTSIPLSMLWNVQMKLSWKMTLVGIFSLVIVTVIFAVARTIMVTSLTINGDTQSFDMSSDLRLFYMWGALEMTVGRCS